MLRSSRNRSKEGSTHKIEPVQEEEEEENDDFMKNQYVISGQSHHQQTQPVIGKNKRGDKDDDDTLAFVGAQYNNHEQSETKKQQQEASPSTLASSDPDPSPNGSDPKADTVTKKADIDQNTEESKPEPDAKPNPTTRKAIAKKRAMDEFLRLEAEKKMKEQEEYLKHKAFMADVEVRRRANVLLNKAKRKRNEIFASQRNGLRKRLVAGGVCCSPVTQ
jgi:hypothetical protein